MVFSCRELLKFPTPLGIGIIGKVTQWIPELPPHDVCMTARVPFGAFSCGLVPEAGFIKRLGGWKLQKMRELANVTASFYKTVALPLS